MPGRRPRLPERQQVAAPPVRRRTDPGCGKGVALEEWRFIADGQSAMLDRVEPKPPAKRDSRLPVGFRARACTVGWQADQYRAARTAGMRGSGEHRPHKVKIPRRIEKNGVSALAGQAATAER